MADVTPTRSVLLELQSDQQAMGEAHAFLDEKRTLLAAEIVENLKAYVRIQAEFRRSYDEALQGLRRGLQWHGLEELQVYPSTQLTGQGFTVTDHSLLGVPIRDVEWTLEAEPDPPHLAHPSVVIERCRTRFRELLPSLLELGKLSGNLKRLVDEYRRTERRTRALEDVLMPELDEVIQDIEAQLEAHELEEAVRVRSTRHSRA